MGSFDLLNGMFLPLGLTGSIDKVLTDVQEKFGQNFVEITDHQKVHGLLHTKIVKMGGLPDPGHI